MFISACM